jgi:hypothetical protein
VKTNLIAMVRHNEGARNMVGTTTTHNNSANTSTTTRRYRGGFLGHPNLVIDINAPTATYQYHACLNELMGYINQTSYLSNRSFTTEEKATITTDNLFNWMCFKAYREDNQGPEDNPLDARSTTSEYAKKAISYFMPTVDNATRARRINRLIAAVKKKENRGLGAQSKADRAFTAAEFTQVIDFMGSGSVGTTCAMIDRRRNEASFISLLGPMTPRKS